MKTGWFRTGLAKSCGFVGKQVVFVLKLSFIVKNRLFSYYLGNSCGLTCLRLVSYLRQTILGVFPVICYARYELAPVSQQSYLLL